MATNFVKYIGDSQSIDPQGLWESFLAGNTTAYAKIFRFYYEDLYSYGLKFCGEPESVRDCIQEVFVEIGKRRSSLAKVNSVKAYLIVCLRRQLLQELKKQQTHTNIPGEQEHPKSFQFSPEDFIIHEEVSREEHHALKQALQLLPSRQREVLFLHYFNGMSYKEIGQILSINYQSVRNHVYRAIKQLRSTLKEPETQIVNSI
jgi:RNA polymerase sigma factor (sigma-70 family)